MKKLFRGPLVWVLVAVLLFTVSFRMLGVPSVQRIDTSDGLALLEGGTVEQAQITDGYQRVDLVLSEDFEDKGSRVQFFYSIAQAEPVAEAIAGADPPGGYDTVVPQTPWWSTLLMTVFSLLLIVGLSGSSSRGCRAGTPGCSTSASPRHGW
jgi:cell division protease FtsH